MSKLILIVLLCTIAFISAVKISAPLLHGAELMNRGLDFREGGLMPEDRVRQRIFKYNHNQGKAYAVPGKPNLRFKVPDECVATYAGAHLEKTDSTIRMSYSETVKTQISGFSFSLGVEAVKFGIGAKFNIEWGRIQHNLRSEYKATANGLYLTTTYSVIGLPYLFMPLDDMFNQVVAMLPTTPTTARDLELYKIAIDYYGGFFMWQGMFGGQIKTYSYFNQKIVESRDQKWLNFQINLDFRYKLFNIAPGGHHNRTSIRIDKEFLANTNGEIYFTGGHRNLQTNTTLKEWDNSIDEASGFLYGKFRPLSDLISNQPIKKKNFEWVIKKYSESGKIAFPPASKMVKNTPKVPGYSVIGSGFDPSHLQVRMSVFDHEQGGAFSNAKTWQNPFYKDIKFSVPSSIYLRENTASLETNFTDIAMTRSEFESTFSKKWTSRGLFSRRSTQVYNYIKRSDLLSQHKITQEKQINWYDLSMNPGLYFNRQMRDKFMNPQLKYIIENLPTKASSSEAMALYELLIEYWGTHFVMGTKMGGRLEHEVFFNKELLEHKSINEISRQSGWSFFGIINSRRYNHNRDAKVEKWFKDNADITTRFIGGRYNPSIGKSTTTNEKPWEEFVRTIRSDPGVLKYELIPIANLIDCPKKKALLNTAVIAYQKKMNTIPKPVLNAEEQAQLSRKSKKNTDAKFLEKYLQSLVNKQ